MSKHIIIGILFALCSCEVPTAEREKHNQHSTQSNPVDALVFAPDIGVTYSGDGAADATVLNDPVAEEVRSILALYEAAIPLMIAHLDDPRLTRVTFRRGDESEVLVTVGHICLDILTGIVDAPDVTVTDCADDGLGACVKEGFYFRPDACDQVENVFVAKPIVADAKANWQRAYREGHLKFVYPAWLKRDN